jgi:hypothetical protein
MKKENKQTYTFSAKPSIRNRAANKAEKSGASLSEVIEALLDRYAPDKRKQKAMQEARELASEAGMSEATFRKQNGESDYSPF